MALEGDSGVAKNAEAIDEMGGLPGALKGLFAGRLVNYIEVRIGCSTCCVLRTNHKPFPFGFLCLTACDNITSVYLTRIACVSKVPFYISGQRAPLQHGLRLSSITYASIFVG